MWDRRKREKKKGGTSGTKRSAVVKKNIVNPFNGRLLTTHKKPTLLKYTEPKTDKIVKYGYF